MHRTAKLLKETDYQLGMTITGGGTGAIPLLLEQGGLSSNFQYSCVPYGKNQIDEIKRELGVGVIDKYGSYELSKLLANHSWLQLSGVRDKLALGCSAVLRKDDQREDRDNHVFVTIHHVYDGVYYSNNFYLKFNDIQEPDVITRSIQEHQTSEFILNCIEYAITDDPKSLNEFVCPYYQVHLNGETLTNGS